jgi:hypothetical protein
MTTAQSPPRAKGLNRAEISGIAAISRARHIVDTLGGRFSVERGIEVDHERAVLAARHIALPSDRDGLAVLAANAHVDLRDLEAGLTHLALTHDFGHCPGGEECPFAQADSEQFVHF